MNFAHITIFIASFFQATASTAVSVCGALPLAYFLYRYHFRGKKLFLSVLLILSIIPTKVAALSLHLLYSPTGFFGIVLGHIMMNLSFAAYVLYGVHKQLDRTVFSVAQQLGASSFRMYCDILFPVVRPHMFSLACIIWIMCFCSISFPFFFATQVYHNTPDALLYTMYLQETHDSVFPYFLLRLCGLLPILFMHYCEGVHLQSMHITQHVSARYITSSRFAWCWVVYSMVLALIFVSPLVYMFTTVSINSLVIFGYNFLSARSDCLLNVSLVRVVGNSLALAAWSSCVCCIIGIGLCGFMHAQKSWSVVWMISCIALAPYLIGSIGCGCIAVWLARVFSACPFVGVVVSHVILNYPFVYRIVYMHYASYNTEWTCAAQSLGASLWAIRKTIHMPFLYPAIMRALSIAFCLSLTEVGSGAVTQGTGGTTLSMALRIYRKQGTTDGLVCLAILLLCIVLCSSLVFLWIEKKSRVVA